MDTLKALTALLTLEKTGENTYVGQNYQAPWGRVFGGQVLAQSLYAAYQTVPEKRMAHSMHGYFILGGQLNVPITYEVDTIRDGGSFTTRRVVALQNGRAIFNMSASFQIIEKGIDHQQRMPQTKDPATLQTALEQIAAIKTVDPKRYQHLKAVLPKVFDFKPITPIGTLLGKNGGPQNNIWMRTTKKKELSQRMQQLLLAYVSDYNLLTTATLPHRETLNPTGALIASIDHALWFHRPLDLTQWLLYEMDSPSASNARGFARGSIYNQEGVLVASVAQEGLIRQYSSP